MKKSGPINAVIEDQPSLSGRWHFKTMDNAVTDPPAINCRLRGGNRPWGTRRNGVKPICIGGVEDHVHLLLSMPTTLSVAKTVQLIKGGSSAWFHETFRQLRNFAWQTGYGAFAVSTSHVPDTIRYIQNQAEHHRVKSFQEEYVGFLKKHRIPFEERFLWD
jgi:putative transposase